MPFAILPTPKEEDRPPMGYDPGASSCLAGPIILDGFVDMAGSIISDWFIFNVSPLGA